MRCDSPRFLHVRSSLRHTLLLYRIRHGVFHEPVLDRSDLGRVERKLGTCLPDNVLAALAATGRRLSDVVRCNEQALRWPDFPRRYIAMASESSEHPTAYWCTLVARQPLARLGVYRWDHERHGQNREVSTAGWLTEYYKLAPPTDAELALIRTLSVRFYPRVEGPLGQDSGIGRLRPRHG